LGINETKTFMLNVSHSSAGTFNITVIIISNNLSTSNQSINLSTIITTPEEEESTTSSSPAGSSPSGSSSYSISDEENETIYQTDIDYKSKQSLVIIAKSESTDNPTPTDPGTRTVYVYADIDVDYLNYNTVNTITLKFKVSKQWIEDNNIDIGTISMYRHSDNQWNELETTMTDHDNEYYYFDAITPRFSYFMIAAEEEPEGPTAPTEPEYICTENETRCNNNNVEQCINGTEWIVIEECSYTCINAECITQEQEQQIYIETWTYIAIVIIIAIFAVLTFYAITPRKKK